MENYNKDNLKVINICKKVLFIILFIYSNNVWSHDCQDLASGFDSYKKKRLRSTQTPLASTVRTSKDQTVEEAFLAGLNQDFPLASKWAGKIGQSIFRYRPSIFNGVHEKIFLTPNNAYAISQSKKGVIRVFDAESNKVLATIPLGQKTSDYHDFYQHQNGLLMVSDDYFAVRRIVKRKENSVVVQEPIVELYNMQGKRMGFFEPGDLENSAIKDSFIVENEFNILWVVVSEELQQGVMIFDLMSNKYLAGKGRDNKAVEILLTGIQSFYYRYISAAQINAHGNLAVAISHRANRENPTMENSDIITLDLNHLDNGFHALDFTKINLMKVNQNLLDVFSTEYMDFKSAR